MLAPARAAWNAAFRPELHVRYLARLEAELGPVPFRLAETPLFLPPALRERLFRHAAEIVAATAAATPRIPEGDVPPSWKVPRRDDLPSFVLVDLAIVRGEDGALDGRLVELQGFPSLAAFSVFQARVLDAICRELPGLGAGFSPYAPGWDEARYLDLLRRALLAGEEPEHVVLLELAPTQQKTLPDFVATEKLLGVEAVCMTDVVREGRRLFRRKGDRLVPIRRIYNRVVFDELERKRPQASFAFSDDLEVSWFPHPDWQWKWSKLALPLLDHPAVPTSRLLSELDAPPADLSTAWVLKPLFSFAGAGVILEPTPDDLARVPAAERSGFMIQRRIEYARELRTPDGQGVAAEVRVMCLRAPGMPLPIPVANLTRLSRGKMLGVDHNRDFDWVGASLALAPTS